MDVHGAHPDPPGRVDVDVADPKAEVESPRAGASDLLAGVDGVAQTHCDVAEERVRRPQPAPMVDGDVEVAGDRTGEHDDPRSSCDHRLV